MLDNANLEKFRGLAETDSFRTLSAQMARAKELAQAHGGVYKDYMGDPRVTQIKIKGNKITYGFDLLAKKAGVRR